MTMYRPAKLSVGFLLCLLALSGVISYSWAQEKGAGDVPEGAASITVDVNVVSILATVRDKDGHLVSNLTKDDFVLEEEGKEQTISYFSRQTDLPLTLGLLVDTSVSQERIIGDESRASSQFFTQVLRLQKDLAFLISFDIDVELLQDLTGSQDLLRSGLSGLRVQGATGGLHPGPVPTSGRQPGTVLFDAVFLAADEMMRNQVGRKALVLISDGVDWGSRVKEDKAIEAAHRADAVIYGVRYVDNGFYRQAGVFGGGGGGSTLRKLARETGGDMYEVSRKHPLSEIYDTIQNELRNQYSIGYSSNLDSSDTGFRKIKLSTKNKSLKVQARSGYYPKS
jgi:VWFA-related protein